MMIDALYREITLASSDCLLRDCGKMAPIIQSFFHIILNIDKFKMHSSECILHCGG